MIACKILDCGRSALAQKLCGKHYQAAKTSGEIRNLDPVETFFASVVAAGHGCWQWVGYVTPYGYGQISRGGRGMLAHCYSYELTKGPIPDGMDLDHLCRNRACVNPNHLEPVTNRENSKRGLAARGLMDACSRGHLKASHGRLRRDGKTLDCTACERERYAMRGTK